MRALSTKIGLSLVALFGLGVATGLFDRPSSDDDQGRARDHG